jgi:hypothetical protein
MNVRENVRFYASFLNRKQSSLPHVQTEDRHTCFSVSLGNDLFKSYSYMLTDSDTATRSVNSSTVNDESTKTVKHDLDSPWPLRFNDCTLQFPMLGARYAKNYWHLL